ncbi:MAG TPA: glycosyltransferase family 4 protein [Candidatus Methylomirabilis sp.]|nr:glycosyltransferase family 4 protein [Candidatus Methylomirabilis sp.]
MRVCLITANFWPTWGGAETQCRLLARELGRRGNQVVILTRARRGAPATDCADGIAVRRTTAFGPSYCRSMIWSLTATAWLRRHGHGFNVIQCYQLLSPAHVGILGRSGRQAVVVRPACSGQYGDVAEVQRLPLTGIRKRMLQRVDAFVTLTQSVESELVEFGLGAIPRHRIPNGVDLSLFSPATGDERRTLRARLGLPEDRILCAFVGRLTHQKDPDLLLQAWALVPRSQAHLVLVGDGPLRSRLEACVNSGPRKAQITFTGASANVVRYLKAADLLVLPSRAEGMSNVILEAMACGLPIVATDLPGNRDVLGEDGKLGLLVPVGNPAPLAEAIETLVASADLRRELGRAARIEVEMRFDIQRVVGQYLSLYEELRS